MRWPGEIATALEALAGIGARPAASRRKGDQGRAAGKRVDEAARAAGEEQKSRDSPVHGTPVA